MLEVCVCDRDKRDYGEIFTLDNITGNINNAAVWRFSCGVWMWWDFLLFASWRQSGVFIWSFRSTAIMERWNFYHFMKRFKSFRRRSVRMSEHASAMNLTTGTPGVRRVFGIKRGAKCSWHLEHRYWFRIHQSCS